MSGLRFSFRAKVLLPVVTIMVLLVVGLLCIVNDRMTRQLETEAAQRLNTADAVFSNSQKIRTRNLVMRFSNIPNEPRFKAASQVNDSKTMRFQLSELIGELDVDMITFTTDKAARFASARRDPKLNIAEFQSTASDSIRQALQGQANVDTVSVDSKLFDVVSIPVKISNRSAGVLTFGVEVGDAVAREFQELTHSQILLLANGRVVASTLRSPDSLQQFTTFEHAPQQVLLGGEHFLALAGRFPSLNGGQQLGYVLLSSYEQPLAALRATQRVLLLLGLAAIMLSTGLVWVLIQRVTRPLRQLREGAERVGRGDFSQRVQIKAHDECGELAAAFNNMTDNLKASHHELETTVDNLTKTKAQLTQSEKLSVIGEFVAGVAHELNNPLASVYGFAQMLQRGGSPVDGKHDHYLDRILRESRRCHKIVQNLLSFARQTPPERKPINLNDLVLTSLEILQYQLRTSNIVVTAELDDELPSVIGDAHQIQQVFVNVINNARQAIEAHRSGGKLRISTHTHDGRVCAAFQDNGPGITPENLEKIFTPFFTTKEAGKGTGLGLSLCYGIVNEHGGELNVRSTLGEGATFLIELPVAEVTTETSAETSGRDAGAHRASQRPGKRVLVVDDEEALRDLITDALVAECYDVDTASDGEAALRKTRGTHYDLVVCDWKMPGLNGLEFYQQLKTTDPATASRFIFLTGDVVGAQKSLGNQVNHWLPKPFSLEDLRTMVNKVAFEEEPAGAEVVV